MLNNTLIHQTIVEWVSSLIGEAIIEEEAINLQLLKKNQLNINCMFIFFLKTAIIENFRLELGQNF